MENNVTGRKIGAYKIQEKVGSGGMATVFKAVRLDSPQVVALKILHEQYSDSTKIRLRFEREAKISSQLDHRHIVPILDFGEFKGDIYLVMPFMEGGSLAGALSEKMLLHYSTSLEMLTALADALDYAHSRGVIHRDFKLENILLDRMSVPSISDFGIAQFADATNITVTGNVLGSPLYFAPENFAGTDATDYRLDLYAFAVTAYLMFTGYFPFTGPNAFSIIDKHQYAELPLPSQINPQLPTALDAIFAKAMAKDPEKRFSSASEFVSRLDTVFATIPAGATTIFLNQENPLWLSAETPSSIREALNADDVKGSEKTVLPIGMVPKNLLSGDYRKLVTPLVLGGVLSACLVLSAGAQYLVPGLNPQVVNHELEEFKAGQTLIATQAYELYETEVPASTLAPTISPSSTKPAGVSQSEPLSVPTEYIPYRNHDNHRPQPRSPRNNAPVILATNPPPVVNQPQNNPQPTNPPRNNNGGGGNGGNGGSGRGGGGNGGGGSGRDGDSGRGNGNGNGNGNGRGNGRGGS